MCVKNGSSSQIQCYQCDGVQTPGDCHKRVTCQHNEICSSIEYLTDFLEVKYRLGCESRTRCTLLNINKTRRVIPFCSQCCPLSGCNRHLCDYSVPSASETTTVKVTTSSAVTSAHTQTTTKTAKSTVTPPASSQPLPTIATSSTTSTCEDSPHVDCQDFMNEHGNICNPIRLATTMYCPRSCGLCGTTSSVNTTASTPSVSTTSAPCFDDDDVDCHALNDILDICNPVTEQTRTMCPRFCGICDITYSINTITTTSGPCLDSHLVNCTSLNQIQNICSPVTEMSTTWCPQFCGLCGENIIIT
ncbi:mucin-5AC-like isoform X2 [Gigantopelta aegis]|nr:mucin-5AC-like isoform X2 [Gigantopelta aegis]